MILVVTDMGFLSVTNFGNIYFMIIAVFRGLSYKTASFGSYNVPF
jgi:hypothetical protein